MPQHEWIPYRTDRLRKLIDLLGFIPKTLSANEGIIYYVHTTRECLDQYRPEIGIVISNVISKQYTLKIIEEIIQKYGFTEKEIKNCCKKIKE